MIETNVNEKLKAAGMLGRTGESTQDGRPGLRERVSDQLRRAINDAQRGDRLAELYSLLHKHPDVARILDLIEEVRG